MSELRIPIRGTFICDFDYVVSHINLKVDQKLARHAIKEFVQWHVFSMCNQIIEMGELDDQRIIYFLFEVNLADPKIGSEPPHWNEIIEDRSRNGSEYIVAELVADIIRKRNKKKTVSQNNGDRPA